MKKPTTSKQFIKDYKKAKKQINRFKANPKNKSEIIEVLIDK